jgi:hypothetical protein
MTAKKKPPAKNVVEVTPIKDEIFDDAIARTLTQPAIQAASTIQLWQADVSEVNALARTLSSQIDAVNNGNMNRPEAMLLAQAHTLDELFNNLARRAYKQSYLQQYETYLRLALKAQTQCRATLETLAAIKNPPVIFAKQANISSGHQQVNNGLQSATHAEDFKNQLNELLEVQNGGETLDSRATSATIGKNKAMETVG